MKNKYDTNKPDTNKVEINEVARQIHRPSATAACCLLSGSGKMNTTEQSKV